MGAKGLERRNAYAEAARKPIFDGELKTQDDVARARLQLMRKVEIGAISAAAGNAIAKGLVDMSRHIERYGANQGAEGGAGVFRLLPGTKLVEMDTELDYVLTKDDLERIDAGLKADERAGVPTPEDMADIVERYLGKKTRRHDRTRAQLRDEVR